MQFMRWSVFELLVNNRRWPYFSISSVVKFEWGFMIIYSSEKMQVKKETKQYQSPCLFPSVLLCRRLVAFFVNLSENIGAI